MLRRFSAAFGMGIFCVVLTVAAAGSAVAAAARGTLTIAQSSYTVAQSAKSISITVKRTGGTSGKASVHYLTAAGTALTDIDFTRSYAPLNWADGDGSAKTFSIPISDAKTLSKSRTFTVNLLNPVGAVAGSPKSTSVTITPSAATATAAVPGTLVLASSNYTVPVSATTLTVTVHRTGGSKGAVTVAHATASGTAVAGQNFTATSGTLSWKDGDASAKSFSIPIKSTTFTGSKSFTVSLSSPSGGASISTPTAAQVAIDGTGTTSSSGAPAAPGNLLMMGQMAGSVSLAWNAATGGSGGISYYKIYRNGAALSNASGTSFTDYSALNATSASYSAAANIYEYAVSAVDGQGNEGPQTDNMTFQIYANGVFYWEGDYSYGATINYKDTSGAPESGAYDIAVKVAQGGGFQPYAGNVVPVFDMEAGAFEFVSVDLKPTISGQVWRMSAISRLPPGDVYPWGQVDLSDYGPAPVAGKWATYKIPLAMLTIGKSSFQGSISGTTLTVTKLDSGVGVDAGGFISGPGIKANTYITGHNADGGAGTYTISPAQNVASTTITEQRTSIYKFDIINDSGASTYYVDNWKLLSN